MTKLFFIRTIVFSSFLLACTGCVTLADRCAKLSEDPRALPDYFRTDMVESVFIFYPSQRTGLRLASGITVILPYTPLGDLFDAAKTASNYSKIKFVSTDCEHRNETRIFSSEDIVGHFQRGEVDRVYFYFESRFSAVRLKSGVIKDFPLQPEPALLRLIEEAPNSDEISRLYEN